jgi:hypothetical protein
MEVSERSLWFVYGLEIWSESTNLAKFWKKSIYSFVRVGMHLVHIVSVNSLYMVIFGMHPVPHVPIKTLVRAYIFAETHLAFIWFTFLLECIWLHMFLL